jgi:hypothetical protein
MLNSKVDAEYLKRVEAYVFQNEFKNVKTLISRECFSLSDSIFAFLKFVSILKLYIRG